MSCDCVCHAGGCLLGVRCIMSLSVLCTNLQLWEAVSGKCVATLVGHKEEVLDVCFDLSGQLIATASADGESSKSVCHAT